MESFRSAEYDEWCNKYDELVREVNSIYDQDEDITDFVDTVVGKRHDDREKAIDIINKAPPIRRWRMWEVVMTRYKESDDERQFFANVLTDYDKEDKTAMREDITEQINFTMQVAKQFGFIDMFNSQHWIAASTLLQRWTTARVEDDTVNTSQEKRSLVARLLGAKPPTDKYYKYAIIPHHDVAMVRDGETTSCGVVEKVLFTYVNVHDN